MSESVVIVGAKRTPVGAFQGQFAGMTAPQLASVAIKAAVEQAGVKGEDIDEALMGCCLMAGLRQAPARQAVLGAGLPKSVPCVTLTKMCSSAQKTVMIAHDELLAGSINIAVAGGMESMTNAPHVLTTARSGYRLGNGVLHDHMFLDGLEDAYEQGKLMGAFAELCVDKYSFSREEMDAFAIESVTRAQKAVTSGVFSAEIAPVTVTSRKGEEVIALDETPMKCDVSKITKLKPAFKKDGAVTPANSSSISDGAAAFVLMRESDAKSGGITPLARIVGHATFAHDPAWFTHRPGLCLPETAEEGRLAGRGRRPLGDQRGFRSGHDGVHAGSQAACRQGQRQWRRLCSGASDWCHGFADPGDAALRAQSARPQAGHRRPLRWRR
jgi:acetyl-CoA C-acetyltransferase